MMSRMKEVEEENQRLKKMYLEEKINIEIMRRRSKKVVRPSRRREMAQNAQPACRRQNVSVAKCHRQLQP
jgi:hypothetical protein